MKEYEKNGVERKFPYCDYQIYAESEWQYGWSSEELEYKENSEYECAFSTAKPLCSIKAKVQKIDWGFRRGIEYIAADKPRSRKAEGAVEDIELIPYACAKLRMTELPFVE